MASPYRLGATPAPADDRPRALSFSLIAACAAAGWTLVGPAGLSTLVTERAQLDGGWFGLGLLLFQGPCALANVALLALALARGRKPAIAACVATIGMEIALWSSISTISSSGC